MGGVKDKKEKDGVSCYQSHVALVNEQQMSQGESFSMYRMDVVRYGKNGWMDD